MTPIPTASIAVIGLTWRVNGRTILDNVDLQLSPSETLGIVGPNGSGKSSLLRCIYGEQRPTSGHIHFNGRLASDFSRRELAQTVAVVLQHHTVDAGVTVAQVIELGRLPHRRLLQQSSATERDLLARCARHTGVTDFLNAPFQQLSGGEQQRVILARALAQEPSILLLDEPTNHLDLRYQVELIELIGDLAIPTIVVLHDLTLAARLCHRLLVLDSGRVHTQGPPRDVVTNQLLEQVWQVGSDILHDSNGAPVVVPRSAARQA